MEWIQGNWLWLLLGLGVVWFLFRGGGCGMGGHGSHRAGGARDEGRSPRATHDGHDNPAVHNGHGDEEAQVAGRGQRGHRGC